MGGALSALLGGASGSCGPTRSPCSWGRRSTTCTCGASAPASARGAVVLTRADPGVHGPADDRARHRSSARTPTSAATAPSRGASRPARSRSAPTRWSASSRCWTSVRCWATAPSWATRRRCSPGRWCRTARAGTARPPSGATSTTGWSPPARCGRLRRFAYGAVAAGQRPGPVRPARPRAGLQLPRAHPGAPAADRARHDDGRRPGRAPAGARLRRGAVRGRDRRRARVRRHRPAPGAAGACARTPCTRSTGSATGCTGSSRGRRTPASTTSLFGDSSAIVHYLRLVGYRFGRPLVQSGSNFGVAVRHENPYLSGVGSGTMVSDGLSFMNAEYSSTSFRLRRAQVGDRNFLGNDIAYPAGARTGDNCLLATKVMVPIDGEVRRDVGLLGSPAFEIPRTVRARPRLRRPQDRRRAPPAAARQEPAQHGHRGAVPARAAG